MLSAGYLRESMRQYSRLHMRLSEACNCYEWRMEKNVRLTKQRREDLAYIRQCIYLISDENILEREIQCYLSNLDTAYDYLFFKRKNSVLRDMLLMVIMEEKSTRIFTAQPLALSDTSASSAGTLLIEES